MGVRLSVSRADGMSQIVTAIDDDQDFRQGSDRQRSGIRMKCRLVDRRAETDWSSFEKARDRADTSTWRTAPEDSTPNRAGGRAVMSSSTVLLVTAV